MGSNSATWSINVVVVIMFKSSYGFSVRMIFAFVFTITLFPSEIPPSARALLFGRMSSPKAEGQLLGRRGGGAVPCVG